MKSKKLKCIAKSCIAVLCAFLVSLSSIVASAEDSVEELEQKTNRLETQLSGLNAELASLSTEINDLSDQVVKTDQAVQEAELNLAAAKLSEDSQYQAMKKRIKYMYENGNTSMLEIIFTSDSMGDFLNNTQFVSTITEYDRDMLKQLKEIRGKVAVKEKELKDKKSSLETSKADLDVKQQNLTHKITSVQGDLALSSQQLTDAKEAQAAAQAALEAERRAQAPAGNGNNTPAYSSANPVSSNTSDIALFAGILECEAGSTNYDALLAVATVIMNRVESPSYPNTLSEVIYQPNQFSPTRTGFLNRVLERGPASLCYTVAQDALNGARLSAVSGCLSFRTEGHWSYGTVIGGNIFF